ncbi:hypothetical protein B566_EDAN015854 [Ephemera danica]|nr:hypothetical protein B566_EDAN015854 [Ephemera danica]
MLAPLLLLLVGLLGCGAQVLRPGRCPGVTPMPTLDIAKYMGVWYEQTHSRRWTGLELKCSLEYFESQRPGSFEVNSFTYSQVANKTFHVRGIAKIKPKQNIQGILSIKVPDFRIDGEVWILGTDYTSYTVMWSCMNADRLHFENVVVMTRDPQPSNTVIMAAMGVIIKNKIQHTYMQYTSHRECPTIDPVALSKCEYNSLFMSFIFQ